MYPETYSEIYQDLNSPFRPNISPYSPSLAEDALEDDPPNRPRSSTDVGPGSPDFANIGGLTGEDEKFAVKRAESRIWEMCSDRWWEKAEKEEAWYRPLPLSSRNWERLSTSFVPMKEAEASGDKMPSTPHLTTPEEGLPPNTKILSSSELEADRQKELEDMFKHGASPFRTHPDAPPKFSWTVSLHPASSCMHDILIIT